MTVGEDPCTMIVALLIRRTYTHLVLGVASKRWKRSEPTLCTLGFAGVTDNYQSRYNECNYKRLLDHGVLLGI